MYFQTQTYKNDKLYKNVASKRIVYRGLHLTQE